MLRALTVALLGMTFVVSCEKSSEPTTPPADAPAATDDGGAAGDADADAGAAEDTGDEGPKVWADMNLDERKMHMGTVVYPNMKSVFAAYDAERFGDFKCQTCHGDDMVEVNFKMPNSLTPLSATDPWQSAVDMDEDMAKFMAAQVVPKMGEDLHMSVEQDGSGEMNCFSCHLKDE